MTDKKDKRNEINNLAEKIRHNPSMTISEIVTDPCNIPAKNDANSYKKYHQNRLKKQRNGN